MLIVVIFIDLGLGGEGRVSVNHIHLQGERKVVVLAILLAFDHNCCLLNVNRVDRVDRLGLLGDAFNDLWSHDGDSLDFADVVVGLG